MGLGAITLRKLAKRTNMFLSRIPGAGKSFPHTADFKVMW